MHGDVDLVVPIKTLDRAKSRLAAPDRSPAAHAALALAFALDTVSAARSAAGVRRVIGVTSDPVVRGELAALGVPAVADPPGAGLNAAVRCGVRALRDRKPDRNADPDPDRVAIGVLQADLPALRPRELAAALAAGAGRRAYCPDRHGTGTTLLLLGGAGADVNPRFGADSAAAHAATGAAVLIGDWPSLRCDVDTQDDLMAALELGLGPRSARELARR